MMMILLASLVTCFAASDPTLLQQGVNVEASSNELLDGDYWAPWNDERNFPRRRRERRRRAPLPSRGSAHWDPGSTVSKSTSICIAIPVSRISAATHNPGTTNGDLAKSVLDTWGSVSGDHNFQIVTPTDGDTQELKEMTMTGGDMRVTTLADGPADGLCCSRPSSLRILQAMREGAVGSAKCSWFMVTDADGYVNPEALEKQLFSLDPQDAYLLGGLTPISSTWNKSHYGTWTSGATGHLISRGLLHAIDWGNCLQEIQVMKQTGGSLLGIDDVEVGACVFRHYPSAKLVSMQNLKWSTPEDPGENKEVRQLVDTGSPQWADVASAHRMTSELNYASDKLLRALRDRS